VAIDHHLVRDVRGDAIVLGSGCVCCTIAGDLVRALAELRAQLDRGELPPIDRVVLETTGLADPTGALATLVQHPLLARAYRPHAVVTVVDGLAGDAILARHREAQVQVALADRVIVAKADLIDDAGRPP
jgi:G3E family GTPase